MTTKKQAPVVGTTEEWAPKTAHEIAIGMFHGLPNTLVPARHHLAKVPGTEAKIALKAINHALGMVTECVAKFARVPGPMRANFRDGDTFVIVETDTNRVTADGNDDVTFQQVNLLHRKNSSHEWVEVTSWDFGGWAPTSEDFKVIIGAIAKVIAGIEVTPKDVG